jgi:hypothetical protein
MDDLDVEGGNIRVNLRLLWVELIQNRDQWQVLVTVIMKAV